jgi:hypothetical protein
VPYPYLVPEHGGDSYVYRNLSTDRGWPDRVEVSYNSVETDPYTGDLGLWVTSDHFSGDYAFQVTYLCSADYPFGNIRIYPSDVTDVTSTSATLKALVAWDPTPTYPPGARYWAEYGTAHARYTSRSAEQSFTASGGNTVVQAVSITLEDLLPGTTYHYRLAANPPETSGHVSYSGPDLTFTTAGVATPTSAPTVKWWAQRAPFGTKWKANTQVRYAVSFVAPEGEGGLGPWGPWGGAGWALGYLTDIPTDPSGKATSRRIYRHFQGGQPELIGVLDNDTDTEYQDENY